MSLESNKLIAKFLGLELTTDGISDLVVLPNNGLIQVPKYNLSWYELMSVVEKIESLDLKDRFYTWDDVDGKHYNFQGIYVEIEKNHCWIYAELSLDPSFDFAYNTCDSKIEAVYKSVLEFIKWYNDSKQDN